MTEERKMISLSDIKLSPETSGKLTKADHLMIDKALEGINRLYNNVQTSRLSNQELLDRVNYELETICSMGLADYFLIVADFLDVGRRIGYMPDERIEYLKEHCYEMSIDEMEAYINEDQSYPGLTIGPGRGSGAGSVITYALQITTVEPTQYDLLFDRFLNPERVSMPDIDSDLSKGDAPYGVRDIVVEYVSKKYGRDGVCGIATVDTLAAKAAIENTARILGDKAYQQEFTKHGKEVPKTSESKEAKELFDKIRKSYADLGTKIKAEIPKEVGIKFGSKMNADDPNSLTVLQYLKQKFENDERAQEIITLASQLEGVNYNYGMHAAGKIIVDNGDAGAYGALMRDPKTGGWKLQMDAPSAESLAGLLKMDFLGLQTLNIVTMAARLVYENTNHAVKIDLLNLPQEAEVYQKIFCTGNTIEVFQFESGGMKNVLRSFGPSKFEDIVLLNAIFRPGPMQYIDPITRRKHGEQIEESAFDRIPIIQELLAPTYGFPVYQEQVMKIFQIMGQYTLGGADEIRRAMSKKKTYIIQENRDIFVHGGEMENHVKHIKVPVGGAVAQGIKEEDAYAVFDSLIDFAKYGFNKSHAVVYASIAYMTAWLKYHYPVEFYTACLSIEPKNKHKIIIADARQNHIEVVAPDINLSRANFTCRDGKVYYGFKGLGLDAKAKDDTGDYVSMADYIIRGNMTNGALEKAIKIGMFDRFSTSRKALLQVLPVYMEHRKARVEALKKVDKLQAQLEDINKLSAQEFRNKHKITTKSLPTAEKLSEKIAAAEADAQFHEASIRAQVIPMDQIRDDFSEKLFNEYEIASVYLSGHPMDAYGTPEQYQATAIFEAADRIGSTLNVYGMVSDCRIVNGKKDPTKRMAFFTLEDQSASIDVACFDLPPAIQNEIHDGAILKINGKISINKNKSRKVTQMDESGNEVEMEEEETQLIVSKQKDAISLLRAKPFDVRVAIEGVEELPALLQRLTPYKTDFGHRVFIYDKSTGETMTATDMVSDDALSNGVVVR